jgi:methyl-accepting chemotaxis protein
MDLATLPPAAAAKVLRNRIVVRLWAVATLAGSLLANLVAYAMGLPPATALRTVPFLFLPLVLLAVLVLGIATARQVRHAVLAPAGARLSRLLELPRRIESGPYVLAWTAGAIVFTWLVHRVYGGAPRYVAGGIAGLFAALLTGPLAGALVEAQVQPLAVAEFHRDPFASVETRGFWRVRQRWYLPYVIVVALLGGLFFSGLASNAALERANRVALDQVELFAGPAAREMVRPSVERAGAEGLPAVLAVALALAAVCGLAALLLARRQARAAQAVEESLLGIAGGAPRLPGWVATDEIGDLAFATARISAEMTRVYAQLRAMAAGDLGAALEGDSGLVAAFRGGQAGLRALQERLAALARGELPEGDGVEGDLGATFGRLRASFGDVVAQAETIARGDLRRDVDAPGALGRALQEMTGRLRGMVGRTQSVSSEVGGIVVQLETAAAQLATATTEQVAAITETANTTTEMAQTSAVSADRAAEMIRQGEATAAVVEDGGEAAAETSQAMAAITAALEKIAGGSAALAERVKRIDDITEKVGFVADQSTTLAVNAAVEAARAGDAGKGFAVVAREIRALAGESRQAASQIRALLGEIRERMGNVDASVSEGVRTVGSGQRLAARLGEVVLALGATVHEAVGLMRQVEGSARQHQAGVGQVSQALVHLQRAAESIRDGARLLGEQAASARALSASLSEASGSYALPDAPRPVPPPARA